MLLPKTSSLSGGEGFAFVQWDYPLSVASGTLKTKGYTELIVEWDELSPSTGKMGMMGHQNEAVLGWGMRHTAKRLEIRGPGRGQSRDIGSCCYVWASEGCLK